MSSIHRNLSLALLWLLAGHAFAQGLLCTEDAATGFVFESKSKSWNASNAQSSHRYVVRKSKNPRASLEVSEYGSKTPVAFCEKDFEQDQIRCRGLFQDFFIDRSEMRFLRIYYAGYWNENSLKQVAPDRKQGDDSPSVLIGNCTGL